MRIVFIASTLPAWFLKKNIEILKIDFIVFSKKSILKIFKYFLGDSYEYLLFDDTLNFDSQSKIYSSKNKFFIFHECCWSELDNLIIKNKVQTIFYPISSLNSWIKIDDKSIFTVIKTYGLSIKTIKNYLKYKFLKQFQSKDFKYYFMPTEDDKSSFSLIKALDYKNIINIKIKTDAFGFKNSDQFKPWKGNKIVLLISTDVVSIELMVLIFNKIIRFLQNNKIDFIIKFHPSMSKSIIEKFNFDKNKVYAKKVPFEVSDIKYKYKISLFSTALIFESSKSISLEQIFENYLIKNGISNQKFYLRKNHLRSFENFNKINFPQNLDELFNLILK